MNFQVGDFVIKMNKNYQDKWKVETISHVSDIPKRFICIHEDEYGIKYLKQLTSMGDELPLIIQLTDINEWTRYQVDPEYAEHIMLSDGEDFTFADKRKEEKARREQITRKNKKISTKTNDLDLIDQIFKDLKSGDKFWFSYNIPEAVSGGYYLFRGIIPVKNQWSPHRAPSASRVDTWQIEFEGPFEKEWGPTKEKLTSEEFADQVIFTKEPFSYETI